VPNPSARLLTTNEAAEVARVKPGTIRAWAHRGHLTPYTHRGTHPLYLELHVLQAERDTRSRATTGQRTTRV
jgi:excisionase family DNA binding protein